MGATRRNTAQPDATGGLTLSQVVAAKKLGVDRNKFRDCFDPDRNGWLITVGDTVRYIPNVGMSARRRVPIAALERAINGDGAT